MMRRFLCLLLICGTLLSLTGCSAAQPKDPADFYYRRTETDYISADGVIAPESREIWGKRNDMDALLALYFAGPETSGLESPFPRDTVVLDWSLEDHTLKLHLNETFAQLSGIELTIACGCIARTFLNLADVSTVEISAEGTLLNGEPSIKLTAAALQLSDDGLDKLRTDLTIYYTDSQRRYLIGQHLSVNLAAQDDIVSYLVEQMQTAPTGMGLESALPKNVRLLDSTVEDGVCTLNFSGEFETNAFSGSIAQRTTLLSLVNTLTQLEDIDRVEFQLEGNLLIRYHQINISKALVYDESAVGPVRTGVNEFDATLYVSNGSSTYLSAVPARIQNTTGISKAELVVNALLAYENSNGFYTLFPDNTRLIDITVEDGLCKVNLTEEYITHAELTLSTRSICATVYALGEYDAVQILIEGEIPKTVPSSYFEPMTPDQDWFV